MGPVRTSLVLVLLALSAGCSAPVIHLTWSRPPLLRLSASQSVALEVVKDGKEVTPNGVLGAAIGVTRGQVMNKDMAVEALRAELKGQMQNMGFAVVDRSRADVVIKMTPSGWAYHLEPGAKSLTAGRGRLDITVDVLDLHGTAGQVIFHDEYWASDYAEHLGEPEVMVRASGRVVARFLEDMRPQRVSAKVEMDDSDPVVGPGLELCRKNQFEAAYLALAQALNKKPDSSAALYDLGVMAEIRGSYGEAEDLLKRATEIASKPIYYTALQRVRAARADSAGMQGP
jgi:tetratricopeptide (TPR) repeat protein